MLEVRLLGPVEALSGGKPIPLGGTKPRALLAALVLEHGHVVSASTLVDIVWPENPPVSARALIQTYISSLRKSFAAHGLPDVIDTRPPGYTLKLTHGQLDIDIFTDLVGQARAASKTSDDDSAATLLTEALALWRGPALSGLEGTPLAAEARRLDELRLAALEERFDAELRMDRLNHVAELTGLVSKHPANERLRGQLMTMLYRLGRQADALACYREGRDALVEELGVEPGPGLAALNSAILRGDPLLPEDAGLGTAPSGRRPKVRRPEVRGSEVRGSEVRGSAAPAGLPLPPGVQGVAGAQGAAGAQGVATRGVARVRGVAGAQGAAGEQGVATRGVARAQGVADTQEGAGTQGMTGTRGVAETQEVAGVQGVVGGVVPAQIPPAPPDFTGRAGELDRLVEGLKSPFPGVHVVTGQGGSGKSTLATFAAHRVASWFPDGQLYAELRGMTDAPATPAEVLGGFLRALGVAAALLPDSAQERTELFRSLAAGRRILLVLDDAAGEQQVRPLLPGGQGCGVLITSRDRLAGLSGAKLTELDMLTDAEALQLFSRVAGTRRVAAESEAAQSILRVCENLPLAIRVVGARLATRRHLPLALLAGRLTDERQRLDELSVGDLAVRASIGLSYRALTDVAKIALRRMAFLGVPDFSAAIVGRLLEMDEAEAERRLESLVDAQLATFTGPDRRGVLRYRLHDLVRLYARERAEQEESPETLSASVARVVTAWLEMLERIAVHAPPAEIVWHQAPLEDRVVVLDGGIIGDAARWMQGEEAAMAAGVERAAALGQHRLACEFVIAQASVEMEGANRFDFRARVVGAALEAARRAGDVRDEAGMLAQLAQLRYAQDIYDDSRRYFNEALSRFRLLHDVRGQAAALAGLGAACREPGRLAEAIHFLDQAAALLRSLDDQPGIGYVYRLRGSVLLEQGSFDAARADLETSLRAYREAGSERGVAYTLRSIGLHHRAIGEYEEAMRACGRAAAIFESLGDELMRSYAVRAEAKAQMRLGDAISALPRLEWALWTARNANDRWGQACTLRVLGQLHLSQGRLDLAESCLDAAMSIWEGMDASLWRARTRYDLSLLHRERGDVAAAEAMLAEACQIFHDHGAREYTEICR